MPISLKSRVACSLGKLHDYSHNFIVRTHSPFRVNHKPQTRFLTQNILFLSRICISHYERLTRRQRTRGRASLGKCFGEQHVFSTQNAMFIRHVPYLKTTAPVASTLPHMNLAQQKHGNVWLSLKKPGITSGQRWILYTLPYVPCSIAI